jgi:hypothetical protein
VYEEKGRNAGLAVHHHYFTKSDTENGTKILRSGEPVNSLQTGRFQISATSAKVDKL